MNLAGMPITVSAPNQVAKVVVTTMISGRLRPAIGEVGGVLDARAGPDADGEVPSR